MIKNNSLALFDFDGTITAKDTFIQFIQFTHSPLQFIGGMLLLTPILILYKLKIIKNNSAKEYVLRHFYGKWDYEKFKMLGEMFCEKKIPFMLKKSAIEKIKYHQQNKHRVILVTASCKEWVAPWCKKMGIEIISTEIEILNNTITGKLATPNCYGPEKVNRIKSILQIKNYSYIYTYGDSKGDKEMLAMAQSANYKCFKN